MFILITLQCFPSENSLDNDSSHFLAIYSQTKLYGNCYNGSKPTTTNLNIANFLDFRGGYETVTLSWRNLA